MTWRLKSGVIKNNVSENRTKNEKKIKNLSNTYTYIVSLIFICFGSTILCWQSIMILIIFRP